MNRDEARAAVELRILRGTQAHALARNHVLNARGLFDEMCEHDHARGIKGMADYPHEHAQTI